jgi:hypothetical protein
MTINRDITLWACCRTHSAASAGDDAIYPDGRTETILAVPNYDFEWQTDYIFKQPLKLPRGPSSTPSRGRCSPGNKSNPDATKDVWWGDRRSKR